MRKRKSILLGAIVLAVTLGVSAMFAAMKEPPKRKEAVSRDIIVPVKRLKNTGIPLVISVVGNIEAHEKVEVFAEVNGILESSDRSFLEGVSFQKGETLLRIKDDKYRSNLYASKSNLMNQIASLLPDLKFDFPESYDAWKDYLASFNIEESLKVFPKPRDEKEKYFIAGKKIYQTYYDIKSMEEELVKYTIRAPFDGKITESNIKPGTLVRSGQKLGEFLNTASYDLVVGVDLNNLKGIQVGNKVRLRSENVEETWIGKVSRISPKVDAKTQMVNVYIAVSGKSLKEGMFLTAEIQTDCEAWGMEIPRKLLVDTDHVLVVENDVVKEFAVNIVQYRENTIVVEGLKDGIQLAQKTSGIHKGLKVKTVEQ